MFIKIYNLEWKGFHAIPRKLFINQCILLFSIKWNENCSPWSDVCLRCEPLIIFCTTAILFINELKQRLCTWCCWAGKPSPAEFRSAPFSRAKDSYNLTWLVESYPPLDEVRLLYRKVMVSSRSKPLAWWACICVVCGQIWWVNQTMMLK